MPSLNRHQTDPSKPPAEFYVVRGWFNTVHEPDWGDLTDGFANQDEAIEAVREHSGASVHVILVNLEEGSARDVTEDILSDVEADSDGGPSDPDFQRREAWLAGHFS